MRQDHRAGEKLFVDYAGQTASVIYRRTGEERCQWQLKMAHFRDGQPGAEVADLIGGHVRAPEYFYGRCRRSWCRTILISLCICELIP